eukprot:scaffold1387_cov382-Prasinococcus_capsulatus_cf.AAC.6
MRVARTVRGAFIQPAGPALAPSLRPGLCFGGGAAPCAAPCARRTTANPSAGRLAHAHAQAQAPKPRSLATCTVAGRRCRPTAAFPPRVIPRISPQTGAGRARAAQRCVRPTPPTPKAMRTHARAFSYLGRASERARRPKLREVAPASEGQCPVGLEEECRS